MNKRIKFVLKKFIRLKNKYDNILSHLFVKIN